MGVWGGKQAAANRQTDEKSSENGFGGWRHVEVGGTCAFWSPALPEMQILKNQPFKPVFGKNRIYLPLRPKFFLRKSKKMLASHPLLA